MQKSCSREDYKKICIYYGFDWKDNIKSGLNFTEDYIEETDEYIEYPKGGGQLVYNLKERYGIELEEGTAEEFVNFIIDNKLFKKPLDQIVILWKLNN